MMIMLNVAEIRKECTDIFIRYIGETHDHGYTWNAYNIKGECISFINWLFKRYFKERGFLVLDYIAYDDYNLFFRENTHELMYYIDFYLKLRTPNLFNLKKRDYLLSLVISNDNLVISLENEYG